MQSCVLWRGRFTCFDVFKDLCTQLCSVEKPTISNAFSNHKSATPCPGLANLPMNLKTCLAKGMKMMLQLRSPLELLTPVFFLGKLVRKCFHTSSFSPPVDNKNAAVFLVDNCPLVTQSENVIREENETGFFAFWQFCMSTT